MCSHLPINKICFRNCRKRKALEINTNHMERKVMQRRSNPLVEYKSSQSSQETNVNLILKVELAPMDTKNDLTDDDEESSTSSGLSQGWSAKLTNHKSKILYNSIILYIIILLFYYNMKQVVPKPLCVHATSTESERRLEV